jgi:hypothetical protein
LNITNYITTNYLTNTKQKPKMEKIVLFFNNSGNGAANMPYFTGKIKFPDGTEKKVSLWSQVSATGTTYYSGNVQPISAEGYRNIVPPPAPAQDQPAPAEPEPTPEPADPDFIQDQIKHWEDRTKAEIPDLGRQRLEAPRKVEATNRFLEINPILERWPHTTAYILAKDLIEKIDNQRLDVLSESDYLEYTKAKATVAQYENSKKSF